MDQARGRLDQTTRRERIGNPVEDAKRIGHAVFQQPQSKPNRHERRALAALRRRQPMR